jgi:hypothetical protein
VCDEYVPYKQNSTQLRVHQDVRCTDHHLGVSSSKKIPVEERRDIRPDCCWHDIEWHRMYFESTRMARGSKHEGPPGAPRGSGKQMLLWSETTVPVLKRFNQYSPDYRGAELQTPIAVRELGPFISMQRKKNLSSESALPGREDLLTIRTQEAYCWRILTATIWRLQVSKPTCR